MAGTTMPPIGGRTVQQLVGFSGSVPSGFGGRMMARGMGGSGGGYPFQTPPPDRPVEPPNEGYTPYDPGPITVNPYAPLQDFSGRSVTDDPSGYALPPGQLPPNILERETALNQQIRGGGYGNMPSYATVQGMQQTLNAIRQMGGINHVANRKPASRSQVGRGGGPNPAAEAIRLRRIGANSKSGGFARMVGRMGY